MRPITERELLLQNLVATGANLLYRASHALSNSTPEATREAVIIEVETWFAESKQSIIEAMARPDIVPVVAPPPKPEPDIWVKPDRGNLSYFLD